MILGAKDGFSELPENLKSTVVQTNKEVLGIDLVMMAEELTALKFPKSE